MKLDKYIAGYKICAKFLMISVLKMFRNKIKAHSRDLFEDICISENLAKKQPHSSCTFFSSDNEELELLKDADSSPSPVDRFIINVVIYVERRDNCKSPLIITRPRASDNYRRKIFQTQNTLQNLTSHFDLDKLI